MDWSCHLSAIDDVLRHPDDAPSIGIILCKAKNQAVAEYTLRDMSKPISVAEHLLTEALPEDLRASLPTTQELEEELNAYEEGILRASEHNGDSAT